MFEEAINYELAAIHQTIPQYGSEIYYHHITSNNLPARYIDNGVNASNLIREVIWHSQTACLEVSGLVEAEIPINLTIAVPCVNLTGVEFKNIWSISVTQNIDVNASIISYNRPSDANITIDGMGNENSPIHNLYVNGNVDLRGENWISNFNATGERFNQSEFARLISPGWFNVDVDLISISNASLLEVGEYYLQGKEIFYNGMLHAKRGDLVISYLGEEDFNINQNLSAVGTVKLYSKTNINNYQQIVAKSLEVYAPIFRNYCIISIIFKSSFNLLLHFYNSPFGDIKTGRLYIGSNNAENKKIKSVKNQGRIEMATGEIHAIELENIASNFIKTDFIQTQYKYDRCSKGKSFFDCFRFEEQRILGPQIAILSSNGNIHLHLDIYKTTSSKLESENGQIFFYSTTISYEDHILNQYGSCYYGASVDESYYATKGQVANYLSEYGQAKYESKGFTCCDKNKRSLWVEYASTKDTPIIIETYNSRIYSKQGVEGAIGTIKNAEISWTTEELLLNGTELILYDASSSKALTRLVEKQKIIYFRFMEALARKRNMYRLELFPSSAQIINRNLFTLHNKLSFTPGTVEYLITKRNDLLQYEYLNSQKALVKSSRNAFDKYIDILKIWSLNNNLAILLLGDQYYLNQLFENRIFTDLGYITGLNNKNLAQELISNAIEIEIQAAYNRGQPFEIGKPLSKDQISKLTQPIAWFIAKDNCIGSGFSCFVPEIYWTEASLKNFIWEAGIISEGDIYLNIVGDVLFDAISNIIGKDIILNIGGNIVSFGLIDGDFVKITTKSGAFINKIKTSESFSLQAVNAILTDHIQSDGDITLEIAQDLAIATIVAANNYGNKVTSHIVKNSIIEAKGTTLLTAKNIGIRGAKIFGRDVHIKTADQVIIIPVELYSEAISYAKKYYSKYRELKTEDSFIFARGETSGSCVNSFLYYIEQKCNPGSIVIDAGKNIRVKGGKYIAQDSINLISSEEGLTIEASKSWQSFHHTQKKKSLFSSRTKTTRTYEEIPNLVDLDSRSFYTNTKKDQNFTGINIISKFTKLIAGTPQHAASVSVLPVMQISEMEIQTKSKGFSFKFENNGLTVLQKTKQVKGKASIEPIPSLLQIEEEFYVYSNGKYIHVQPMFVQDSSNQNKLHGIINARDIHLESAPGIYTQYSYLNRLGNGVGFSSKTGEYAIKAAISIESHKHSRTKIIHKTPQILSRFLKLNASHGVYDQGIFIHAQEININSKITMHGISLDIESDRDIKQKLETGVKLGVRSNFANLLDTGDELIKQDYKTPEGIISAAFRTWNLYINILRFLSGDALTKGAWFYLEGGKAKETEDINIANPTRIITKKLNITTEKYVLRGTQIHAINATIKAKEIDATASENSYNYYKNAQSANSEIPLGPSGLIPGLRAVFGKDKIKQKQKLNIKIYVSNRLTMEVEATANMTGVNIEAQELTGVFGDLILESLQDICEMEGKGLNFGIGLTGIPNMLGAKLKDSKRHVVDSLSSIIGRKSTEIVVANALMLNGAMIANAKRDEQGKYIDHGNFVLKIGELFIQHIHNHNNGHIFQGAIDFARKTSFIDSQGKKLFFENLETTLALNKGQGWTRATLGSGQVECIKENGICETNKANRDLNSATSFKNQINLKPIYLFYSNLKLSDFKLPKNPREFLENIAKDLGFKNSQIQEVQDIEYEKLSEEDKETANEYLKQQTTILEEAKEEIAALEQVSTAEKATEITTHIKILKVIAKKIKKLGENYSELEQSHPFLVKWGLSGLNITLKTLIAGIPGLIAAAKQETLGIAIATAGAPLIKKTIKTLSKLIYDQFPELTEEEAKSLAAGGVIGSLLITNGSSSIRYFLRNFKKFLKTKSLDNLVPATGSTTTTANKNNNNLFNVADDVKIKQTTHNIKLKSNPAISNLDIKKFGDIITKLAQNAEFNKIASKWGIGKFGTNQLLEHTLGKVNKPGLMESLEFKAGLAPGALSDVYSGNPNKVINAMKNFDDLASKIKSNPTHTKILDNGKKTMYWKRPARGNLEEGIGYVEYNRRSQTIMRMDYEQYKKY